ncbi:MAG: antibiotic biosynthesis monooxygenase [Thermoleophilia bacterium]|nr:antibiotic biosynthesis monooxygenase [Thermoleophilia bacterium]
MLIVTAKVKLQSGKSEEFLEAVRVMKPQVMQDPGAIQYSLHRSVEDPDTFIFYEQYESEEAFAYHLSTDHFKALAGTIDPLMAVPGDIGQWVEVL